MPGPSNTYSADGIITINLDNTSGKKYEKITIEVKENGFLVHCGCKQLVFESRTKLIAALNAYYDDPSKAQGKYCGQKP